MKCEAVALTPEDARLHARAVELAEQMIRVQAELIETLDAIERSAVHEACGANSLYAYGVEHLRLDEVMAYGLVTVMRRSRDFPRLRAAVAGGLALSRAVRIGPVLTPESEGAWIEKALHLSKAQLERAVAEASPEPPRREVVRAVRGNRFEMLVGVSAKIMNDLRRAQDLVSRGARENASLETTLGAVTELYLEKKDPVRRAARSMGRVNAAAINAVHVRDGDLCQMVKPSGVKCQSGRFVDIHHVVPRALGGSDEADNLITLCSSCHRLWHHRHGLGPEPGA